jgi:hypothetical protein
MIVASFGRIWAISGHDHDVRGTRQDEAGDVEVQN